MRFFNSFAPLLIHKPAWVCFQVLNKNPKRQHPTDLERTFASERAALQGELTTQAGVVEALQQSLAEARRAADLARHRSKLHDEQQSQAAGVAVSAANRKLHGIDKENAMLRQRLTDLQTKQADMLKQLGRRDLENTELARSLDAANAQAARTADQVRILAQLP